MLPQKKFVFPSNMGGEEKCALRGAVIGGRGRLGIMAPVGRE